MFSFLKVFLKSELPKRSSAGEYTDTKMVAIALCGFPQDTKRIKADDLGTKFKKMIYMRTTKSAQTDKDVIGYLERGVFLPTSAIVRPTEPKLKVNKNI